MNIDKTTLFIKNFPKIFSKSDIKEFLHYFNAVSITIGVNSNQVFAKFQNENSAKEALDKLHQLQLNDNLLSVVYARYACKINSEDKAKIKEIEAKEAEIEKELPEFVKKYFWMSKYFEQPPLPYLKYKYPKVNTTILKNISVALESYPQFYTQVLHLMNLMNLSPPFYSDELNLTYKPQNKSTQTESIVNQNKEDDESELESEEEATKGSPVLLKVGTKRKAKKHSYNKLSKFKKLLNEFKNKTESKSSQDSNIELVNFNKQKIVINVPTSIQTYEMINQTDQNIVIENKDLDIKNDIDPSESVSLTEKDIFENRIPQKEMINLPVYKDYVAGLKSSKLYIKNLSKTVTEEDLDILYRRYLTKTTNDLEIKLMQHGKMKGQAFVKFVSLNDSSEADNIAEKALQSTNGYILKCKPMVVMFGKR